MNGFPWAVKCFLFGIWLGFFAAGVSVGQDSDGARRPDSGANTGPVAFSVEAAGEPPRQLARLVDQADVDWLAGPRDPSWQPPANDRIVAETRYKIEYQFRSRSHWRLTRGSNPELVIAVSYRNIEWNPRHEIWFFHRPEDATFWENTLVLHELDHVRISSDPRFREHFVKRLKDTAIIRLPPPADGRVNSSVVSRVIDRHVADLFEQTSQLIAIRYLELDRLTSHGQRPLDADSEIARWMNQTETDEDQTDGDEIDEDNGDQ